jgi:hypothetical protein
VIPANHEDTSTSTAVTSTESGPVVFGYDGKPVVIAPLPKPATPTGVKGHKTRRTDRDGGSAFAFGTKKNRKLNAFAGALAIGSIGGSF